MNKECNIVRDLIPVYAEDLASEESADFVTEHCNNCDECRKQLEYALNPIKSEEEQADKNMKNIFENLDRIQKKHFIKKACIISICLLVVLAMVTYLSGFVFNGNTWFTIIEYSDSYYFDEEPYGVMSLTPPPSKPQVEKSAKEIKSFFRQHFDGCILLKLVLDEERTTADRIIFDSEFYVLNDTDVYDSGDTVSYTWFTEYNHLTGEWIIDRYD